MRLSADRTGFPVLEWPRGGLGVALLPLLKAQFERFLAEPQGFGDAWYEEVLAHNPRISWRGFAATERERLLLTAISPEEALAFARWLGEEFDLPTVDEWRALDRWLAAEPFDPAALRLGTLAPAARAVLLQLTEQLRPRVWGELSLLRGGALEWVREGDGFASLGTPTARLLPNLFDPQRGEPLRPMRGPRRRYFGARLVRRGRAR